MLNHYQKVNVIYLQVKHLPNIWQSEIVAKCMQIMALTMVKVLLFFQSKTLFTIYYIKKDTGTQLDPLLINFLYI